jgi:hypothetical protein
MLCCARPGLCWAEIVIPYSKSCSLFAELENASKGYMCDGTISITVRLTTTCLNMPASRDALAELSEESEEHSYSASGSDDGSQSDGDG